MEYKYVLFRCEDGKNCEYFPVLKKSRYVHEDYEDFYEYYRISFIPRKKLTKNIIRRLSSLGLIEFMGIFASDDRFFHYKNYSYCIIYNGI